MKKDYIEFEGLRLCLKTREKIQLEELIGNPLAYIFNMMGGQMDGEELDVTKLQLPPLKVIVATIHVAAQRYEHKISKEKVMDIVDDFLDKDGNSVMMLFTEVFMPLLQQAKYLPSNEEQDEEQE
jgi:hypothetical protein